MTTTNGSSHRYLRRRRRRSPSWCTIRARSRAYSRSRSPRRCRIPGPTPFTRRRPSTPTETITSQSRLFHRSPPRPTHPRRSRTFSRPLPMNRIRTASANVLRARRQRSSVRADCAPRSYLASLASRRAISRTCSPRLEVVQRRPRRRPHSAHIIIIAMSTSITRRGRIRPRGTYASNRRRWRWLRRSRARSAWDDRRRRRCRSSIWQMSSTSFGVCGDACCGGVSCALLHLLVQLTASSPKPGSCARPLCAVARFGLLLGCLGCRLCPVRCSLCIILSCSSPRTPTISCHFSNPIVTIIITRAGFPRAHHSSNISSASIAIFI